MTSLEDDNLIPELQYDSSFKINFINNETWEKNNCGKLSELYNCGRPKKL